MDDRWRDGWKVLGIPVIRKDPRARPAPPERVARSRVWALAAAGLLAFDSAISWLAVYGVPGAEEINPAILWLEQYMPFWAIMVLKGAVSLPVVYGLYRLARLPGRYGTQAHWTLVVGGAALGTLALYHVVLLLALLYVG